MDDDKITKFIIKYSIISSLVVWIVGTSLSECLNNLLNLIISPIFRLDLNDDGKPDLHELKEMAFEVGNFRFEIGFFIFNLVQLFLKVAIVYFILYAILFKTKLVAI